MRSKGTEQFLKSWEKGIFGGEGGKGDIWGVKVKNI
jgi:hypothetical protein